MRQRRASKPVAPEGFSILEQWIGIQRSLWERRLDQRGDLLEESDE